MTRLHVVIPVLFLIALTSCIAVSDSYTDQSPEFIFSPGMSETQAAYAATLNAALQTQYAPTHTPVPTNTHTPVPTNTPTPAPTNTPVPPTNTPVPG